MKKVEELPQEDLDPSEEGYLLDASESPVLTIEGNFWKQVIWVFFHVGDQVKP